MVGTSCLLFSSSPRNSRLLGVQREAHDLASAIELLINSRSALNFANAAILEFSEFCGRHYANFRERCPKAV